VAAIDVAGYVADLKDHSVDHGFHVHDERHFVETYSLRQVWEVDLHPEEGCGGPLDLHLALDVDPRILLSFEDAVLGLDLAPVEHRDRADARHAELAPGDFQHLRAAQPAGVVHLEVVGAGVAEAEDHGEGSQDREESARAGRRPGAGASNETGVGAPTNLAVLRHGART